MIRKHYTLRREEERSIANIGVGGNVTKLAVSDISASKIAPLGHVPVAPASLFISAPEETTLVPDGLPKPVRSYMLDWTPPEDVPGLMV